jgi:hypothetical protein
VPQDEPPARATQLTAELHAPEGPVVVAYILSFYVWKLFSNKYE